MLDVIVGVVRGGFILVVRFSYIFGDFEVKVIDVKFYKDIDERMEKLVINILFYGLFERKKVVIVDDVSDIGKIFEVVIEEVKKVGVEEVKVVCFSMKFWMKVVLDFYVFRMDKWIVFLWEEFLVVVRE